MGIKVFIAEDSKILREKLKVVLSFEKTMEVIGEASNGKDTIRLVAGQQPDVILMDIEMEEKWDGIKATAALHRQYPEIQIIMLTVQEGKEAILSAFSAGASDYILKTASATEIIQAIKGAYEQQSPIGPQVAKTIREEMVQLLKSKDSMLYMVNMISKLTPTEIAMIKCLLKGMKQTEIAKAKQLELSTIKTHVRNILKKFQVKRTKDMIRLLEENQGVELISQIED